MKTVLIVGAGIVGVSSAIWLQRAGYRVIIVDRFGPASGASHGNAGILAAGSIMPIPSPSLLKKLPLILLSNDSPLFLKTSYIPKLLPFLLGYLSHSTIKGVERYAKAMAPLIHDSVQQHMSLAKGTEAEEFIKEVDYCFGYETEKDFSLDHSVWDLRKELGFKSEICQGSDFSKVDSFYDNLFEVVVRCKNHGRISDPGRYIKALSDHFISQGGELIISNVQDINFRGKNSVRTIIDGDTITSDKVIIATGAWSKDLIKKFGLKIPLESERGYHIEFIKPQIYPIVPMMVTSKKFVITPMNGRIRAAGLVEFAGLKAGSRRGPLKLLKRQMKNLFPNLKYEEEIEWLGHRPALTDSLPMLGHIDQEKRLFLAFGHQHLGLTGGAKTGRIVSDLIMGKNINLNVSNYRPDRFTN
tara:strand:+ start:27 stop:1268 length:1242 start_codon:yes stop_codon:yes gene_type:complete